MTDVIFVRTRHEYDPYNDFFNLARLSDYPVIYVDQIALHDRPEKTFIITPVNGEWRHGLVTQGRVILWQLEWNTDGEHYTPPGVSEVWCSDKGHAAQIDAKYVPMGSHPRLNWEPNRTCDKLYDVVLLQYLTHRRELIRDELLNRGIRIAPDGWGQARHESLMQARLMLHIHQHADVRTIAPLRWALAAAYKLPIIAEAPDDMSEAPAGIYADYEKLAGIVEGRLKQVDTQEWGDWLYQELCIDGTFKMNVEVAL